RLNATQCTKRRGIDTYIKTCYNRLRLWKKFRGVCETQIEALRRNTRGPFGHTRGNSHDDTSERNRKKTHPVSSLERNFHRPYSGIRNKRAAHRCFPNGGGL